MPEWIPAGVCDFAGAGAGLGVGVLNKNPSRSRSEIFSFYRIQVIAVIKLKLFLTGWLLDQYAGFIVLRKFGRLKFNAGWSG